MAQRDGLAAQCGDLTTSSSEPTEPLAQLAKQEEYAGYDTQQLAAAPLAVHDARNRCTAAQRRC